MSEARGLVFATNRGEDTVSVFSPGDERNAFKIGVGVKPNGVAFTKCISIVWAAGRLAELWPMRSREISAAWTNGEPNSLRWEKRRVVGLDG